MSRDEKIAVVESFLNCIVSNELDQLPIDPELTVESPLIAKLSGQAAMEYVKAVAASTTINGSLPVFTKFQIESGRIKDVRACRLPSGCS